MNLWNGALLAFCMFNLLVLLLCWWLLHTGQKALDRRIEIDEQQWAEALRRLPP